jgi:predicted ATPase
VDVDGHLALVMPLVDGPTLRALLQRYRPTEPEAEALFVALLEATGVVHDAGLAHRDLKPANVLLARDEARVTPRVTDFGLVKRWDGTQLTRAGATMGTPAYAAPELLGEAHTAGAPADIFSLGVLLVELLTGRHPFPGASLDEIVVAHGEGPDLEGLGDRRELLAAMLAVEPERRPSWREVRAHFGDTLALGSRGLVSAAARFGSLVLPGSDPDLPAPRDPFVGRTRELATLHEAFDAGQRLVTLVGLGGSGKTRLALQHARTSARTSGGVYWVDLADAHDEDGVLAGLARTLGAKPQQDPATELGQLLQVRSPCLVVFDNVEQVVVPFATTLRRWLDAAPGLQVLVTSRLPTGLQGERVLSIGSLDEADATSLFRLRAEAVGASVPDSGAVGELVRLLDGLPLAIELAAARATVMRPERLVARLAQRFRLLTSRGGDRPARHQRLQAVLEWSWELLSADEQSALAQLSVFEGGFTAEAADAVVVFASDDPPWIEDVLERLVTLSLLHVWHRGDRPRLAMLVSVAVFARGRRGAAGSAARHAAFFAAESEAWLRGVAGPSAQGHLDEAANLGVATRYVLSTAEARLAVPLVRAAALAQRQSGLKHSALALAEEARTRLTANPAVMPVLTAIVADAAFFAERFADSRREAERVLDDPGAPGLATGIAWLASVRGADWAEDPVVLDRAAAVLVERLDPRVTPLERARCRREIGNQCIKSGRMREAAQWFSEALATQAAWDDPPLLLQLHNGRAEACAYLDDAVGARADLSRAATLVEGIGDPDAVHWMAQMRRQVRLLLGDDPDHERDIVELAEAAAYFTERGNLRGAASQLNNQASRERMLGRYAEAEATYGRALALYDVLGWGTPAGFPLRGMGILRKEQGRYDEAVTYLERAIAVAAGRQMLEGTCRLQLGMTLRLAGDLDGASAQLDLADALFEAVGHTRFRAWIPGERAAIAEARSA